MSGRYPDGVTYHRNGAVTLSGPFGPQGVVARLLPEAAWYAVADAKGVRLGQNGGPLPPFKTVKAAIGWILDNLPRFGVVKPRGPGYDAAEPVVPDLVGGLRYAAEYLLERGAAEVQGVMVVNLLRDAAAEIERLCIENDPDARTDAAIARHEVVLAEHRANVAADAADPTRHFLAHLDTAVGPDPMKRYVYAVRFAAGGGPPRELIGRNQEIAAAVAGDIGATLTTEQAAAAELALREAPTP